MERTDNPEIKKFRDLLHSYYHKWNHNKKVGLSNLPQPDRIEQEHIDKVKNGLKEELQMVEQIMSCCDSLIEEIQKDWRKL